MTTTLKTLLDALEAQQPVAKTWKPIATYTPDLDKIMREEKRRAEAFLAIAGLAPVVEAQQGQEPVKIDYTVLQAFADGQGISYNKLCTAVNMAIITGPERKV